MQRSTSVVSSAVKNSRRARHPKTALIGIAAAAATSLLFARTSDATTDTWVGNSSVNWNDLNAWNPAALPASGDSLIFGAAGTSGLTLTDNLMTPGSFNVAGITFNSGAGAFIINPGTAGTNGFTLTGALTNNGTALETINDLVALPGTQTITTNTGGGNIKLGGVISGAGTLIAAGTGTLTLSANNTFSGNISVTGGTLVASTSNINSSNPTSGPLGNATVARTISVSSGATLNLAVGNILGTGTYNPGNVIMNISGTLTNTSGDTDTLGVVNLTGGTITASSGAAPNFQSYVLSGTVTANGTTQSTISTAGVTNAGYHLGAGSAQTITFNVDPSATGASLLISAPLIGGSGTAGGAAGSAIIKSGVGTLTLSGANTFSGATTINAGTVSIGSNVGYSSASSSLVFGGTTTAVLDFDGHNGTIGGTITANASSVGSIISSVAGSTVTLNGNITANAAFTLGNANVIFALSNANITPYTWTNATATTFTIGGTISRSAGLTLGLVNSSSGGFASSSLTNNNGIIAPWLFFGTGANTEYATNSSNTIIANTGTAAATEANITDTTGSANYELAASGGTITAGVSANTIRNKGGAGTSTLGGGLSVNGLLNAGTGLWTLSGNTLTIGSTKDLVVNAANNAIAITSIIANSGGGPSTLTKTGTNFLTLAGADTYSGMTYIDAGSLILNTGTSSVLNFSGGMISSPVGTSIPLYISGSGSATLGGAISLTGVNNDTNNPAIMLGNRNGAPSANGATLTITGTGTLTGISMGWDNTRNTLNLASTGTLTFSNTNTSLDAGQNNVASAGVVNQTTGTVTMAGTISLGKWDGAYGSYNISGAGSILNVAQILSGGNGNGNGNSWFKQTGGTVNVSGFTSLNQANTGTSAGVNVLYISGGNYNQTGTNGLILGDAQGIGIATVAGGNLTLANANIVVGNNASATGILNLNSGTTEANAITRGSGTGIVNFNGGTLEASPSAAAAFMTGLTSANIYSGGATINTNGKVVTIAQNLLAPTGNGLNNAVVVSNGGSGYLDAPVVKITDSGSGSGATAIATVSGGVVTGITITSPGTGYTNPTFTLFGGGGSGTTFAAYTPTADTTTGGLTVTGSGSLTLSGINTYSGMTTISAPYGGGAGALVINTGASNVLSYTGGFTGFAASNAALGNEDYVPLQITGTGSVTLGGVLSLFGLVNAANGNDTNNPALWMNSNATVTITGTGTISGISMGWGAKSILNLAPAGTLLLSNPTTSLDVAQGVATSVGVVNQTTGTVTASGIISLGKWDGSYGSYNMSGGILNAAQILSGGNGNGNGNSWFKQTGGMVNVSSFTTVGQQFSGTNVLYISAGNYNETGTNGLVLANGAGSLGVATVAGGNLTLANATIVVGNNATAGTIGVLNLNGGITQTNAVTHGSGTGIVNFNGGTLQASANSATAFMTGLTSANIYSAGATIDTNGRAITIAQNLLAPTGNGFNTAVTVSNGGSGYIDAPVVKITDSTGTGATAIATVSGGAVTGITITSPGTGYSATPTFTLAGGGGSLAAASETPTADVNTGGLTVMGSGTLTLGGANTFTGAVQVNGATVSFPADGTGTANPLGAYPGSITAADLSLNGGGLLDTVSTAIGVDRGITLSASGGTLDASAGQTLTVNSVIAGNGALTKGINGGTVVLSNSDTYTGTTTVNGGAFSIAADGTGAVNALGAYPGSITPAAITLNGGGILDTITTTISVNRGITLGASGGTLDASTGQTLVVNSAITGVGSLTKGANTGAVTLTNANNYSGPTVITGGTLDLSNQLAVQNSTVTMNGGSLVFDNSVAGNAFTFGGLASLGVGAGYNIALQNNAGSPAAIALTVGGNNANTTYNGVLSGGGSLTKTGSGTLLLSNSNTYAGTTAISGGTLRMSAIPAGTVGYYTFSNSGNLGLDSSGNGNNLKTGAGAPTQATSGLFPHGTTALSLNGGSSLVPSSSIAGLPLGNSAYTIAAWMFVNNGGNDGIVGWGNYGTGNQVNAFRTAGNTALANYWWANDSQTGTLANMQGTWEYVAATYNSTTNTRVIYLNGVAVKTDNPAAGHAATSANFGVGVTDFSEYFNGMLGNLLITNTSLSSAQINGLMNGSNVNTNVLPSTTPVSMAANTTFDLNGAAQTISELYDANPGTTTGEQVTLGGGTLTVGDTSTKTYSGVISGTGTSSIIKVGSGTWQLAGANTYAGGTTVSAGTLQVGNATALGASSGAVSVTAGAVLDLDGTSMSNTNALTLNGTGISSGGALINSSGAAANYAGLVTLGSTSSIVAGSGGITLSNPGTITGSGFGLTLGGAANGMVASIIGTGSGSVTKTGSGMWTLTGSNTYSGGTTVSAGTLQVANPVALGASSGAVSVTAGAVLDLNGTTMTNTNALTLNGTGIGSGGALVNSSSNPAIYAGLVNLGSSSSIVANGGNIALTNTGTITGSGFGLTLGGNANGSVASIIGTGAAGTVTKIGGGAWTLAGANTYTGGTTISAGTLNVTGSLAAGTVSVSAGATLYGTGTIGGPVTVAGGTAGSGGTISLIDGAANTNLKLSNGLTVGDASNPSNLNFEIQGNNTDTLTITGALNVNAGGGTINITNLGGVAAGEHLTLASYTSGAGIGASPGSGTTIDGLTLSNPNLSFGVSGTLTVTNTQLQLVTTGSTASATAYWAGSKGGTGGTVASQWTGNDGTNGNFTTNANGTGFIHAYPAAGTDVTFAGTGAGNLNNTLGANFDIRSLTFLAQDASLATIGSVNIGGANTLTIEAGGITNSNTNGVSLAMNTLVPNVSQTWTNNSAAGLTINAAVVGSGAVAPTLTINNTTAGPTTFNGTISDGLGGPLNLTVNSSGSGVVLLAVPNTYSGTTTITAGTLQLGDPNAEQNSTVSIGAANGLAFNTFIFTFTLGGLSGSGNQLLADANFAPVTLAVGNNNANTTYSGQLSGASGALTKIGSGTLTLSGSNTYTGATTVNSGTLSLSGSLNGSSVSTAGAGVFSETSTGVIAGSGITFTQSSSGTSILGGPNTYTGATAITTGTLSLSGSVTGSNVTISGTGVLSETSTGVIAGTGTTLTQSTNTTSILAGPNTYTGATSISAGTLSLSGSVTGSNVSTSATGVLSETSTGVIAGAGNTFTQAGSGTSILAGPNTYTGATTVSTGTISLTGSLTGSNVMTTGTGVFSETSSGVFAGAGATFTQSASVASTLAGSNTYGGGTIVNSGTLIAGSTTAFGTATGASLTFGAGSTGIVQLNGNSMTIAGLQTNANVGTPIVESGSATAGTDTLTVNIPVATNNTFAGLLTNGGTRTLSLATNGSGTLTLTAANTYTGGTAVNGGTLVVGNAQALGALSNSLSVGSAGTLSVNSPANTGLAFAYYGTTAASEATFAGSLSGIQSVVAAVTPTSIFNVTTLGALPAIPNQTNSQGVASGMIKIATGGTYTFTRLTGNVAGGSDDDAAIFVNGTAVVPGVPTSNGSPWTQPTTSGTIVLAAGENNIVIPWYQGIGGEGLDIQWSGPDTGNTAVTLTTATANLTPDLYAANLSGSGNVSLATGNLVVGYDNTSTSFTGTISGIGSVNKFGSGTLTLGGANNYTGTTNVLAGTVSLTGSITNSPAINVSSGATLTTNANNPFGSSPTAAWTVAGTLSSTGAGNSVTMPASVALNSGTLSGGATGSSGSFVDSQNTTITATGTSYIASASVGIAASNSLTLNTPAISDSVTVVSALGATSAVGGSLVKTGAGTATLYTANTYTGATVISGGTLSLSPLPAGTVGYYNFSNAANPGLDSSGNGNNLKTGAGSPTWVAGRTGTGGLSLNGGSSLVPVSTITGLPVGNSAYTIAGWMNVANNGADGIVGWGTWGATNSVNAFRTGGNTVLDNYWWGNDSVTGTLPNMQSSWEYVAATYNPSTNTRVIYLNGVAVKTDNPGGGHNAINANFGVGVTNTNEFFTGTLDNVLITNTALNPTQIAAMMNFTSTNVLPATTTVSMAANTTLNLNGVIQTVAELYDATPGTTTGEQVTLGGGTLTVGDASNTTYSGVISGTTGSSNLVKVGAGAWTLAGANTYTGGTAVNSGTLFVNNTSGSGTGTGSVTVNTGARLGGTGSIGNGTGLSKFVSINSGGIISPGTDPVLTNVTTPGAMGVLTTGDQIWNGGQYTFKTTAESTSVTLNNDTKLSNPALNTTQDFLQINGVLDIVQGTKFNLSIEQPVGGPIDNGSQFIIAYANAIDYTDSSGNLVSTVPTGADSNDFVVFDSNNPGDAYNVSIVPDGGGPGFDVVVTVAPEPSSLGLLGIASLGLLRRRRARKSSFSCQCLNDLAR